MLMILIFLLFGGKVDTGILSNIIIDQLPNECDYNVEKYI